MRDYQENVTTGQTDVGQSDLYVRLCFTGNTKSTYRISGNFGAMEILALLANDKNMQN